MDVGTQGPFDGAVVAITGAAGGIGSAIAGALLARGALVANLDLAPGTGSLDVEVDVTSGEQVGRAVIEVEAQLGPVSHAVAAAGVVSERPLDELDEGEWHRVTSISLTGTYHLLREVLPRMAERGSGSAVAVSSGYASMGYERGGHYAAAKAGVEAFVKSVAREFGPAGVRVNAIAPGPVMTPMLDHIPDREAWRRDREARIPLRRIAEPSDVVGPLLFLLGPDSAYVTGQVLHVNGGLLMP